MTTRKRVCNDVVIFLHQADIPRVRIERGGFVLPVDLNFYDPHDLRELGKRLELLREDV